MAKAKKKKAPPLRMPQVCAEIKKLSPEFFKKRVLTLAVAPKKKIYVRIRDMDHKDLFKANIADGTNKELAAKIVKKAKL
jgi:hypothetical protein